MDHTAEKLAENTSTLPQELIDHIIDYLHDDKDSLRCCSLAHRRCLPASSFHLFYRMRFPPCDHPCFMMTKTTVCKCYLVCDSLGLEDLYTLYTKHPRIRENIRDLRIDLFRSAARSSGHWIISLAEVVKILDVAPGIHSLEIKCKEFVPRAPPVPRRTSRSLSSLILRPSGHITDSRPVMNFLCTFSHIGSLTLCGRPLSIHPPDVSALAGVPVRVDRVELNCIPLSGRIWLDLMREHGMLSSLNALVFTRHGGGPVARPVEEVQIVTESLHSVLQNCKAIRSISCDQEPFLGLATYPSTCPSLRELEFRVGFWIRAPGPDSTIPRCWNMITEFMAGQLASTIEDLTLDLDLDLPRDVPRSFEAVSQQLTAQLASLDWGPLRRVHSITVKLAIDIRYREPQTWVGDKDASMIAVQRGIRSHLTSQQRFTFCGSYLSLSF